MFILVTQRPLFASSAARATWARPPGKASRTLHGLVTGARNMIGIGIATATAGVIVGTVTLTGIGLAMTENWSRPLGGKPDGHAGPGRGDLPDPGHGACPPRRTTSWCRRDGAGDRRGGRAAGSPVPLIAVYMFVFYFA